MVRSSFRRATSSRAAPSLSRALQVLALEWIQRNAAALGGDASRVTLLGQSSGGTAILALLAAPSARGLFSSAVALSASCEFEGMTLAAAVRAARIAPGPADDGSASAVQRRHPYHMCHVVCLSIDRRSVRTASGRAAASTRRAAIRATSRAYGACRRARSSPSATRTRSGRRGATARSPTCRPSRATTRPSARSRSSTARSCRAASSRSRATVLRVDRDARRQDCVPHQ